MKESGQKRAKGGSWEKDHKMKLWFVQLVITIVLFVGGVEISPDPLSVQEEAEIFEFIRKTEGI